MKRKVINVDLQQEIVKQYLDGWSMTDLAGLYKISLESVRDVLKASMNTKSPCQARKSLWAQNKFVPVHLKERIDKDGKKGKQKSGIGNLKSIPVAAELIKDRDITHSELGRKLKVSREYVGQIAESLATHGVDVSRNNVAQGRTPSRGVIK